MPWRMFHTAHELLNRKLLAILPCLGLLTVGELPHQSQWPKMLHSPFSNGLKLALANPKCRLLEILSCLVLNPRLSHL